MELSLGVLSWWIILAMVVAIAIIRIVLRDRARSIEGMNGIKPSKEEEIQTLIKEIERLRCYANLLEERLAGEEVAA